MVNRAGMQNSDTAPSDALVVFGITGDLAFKKIIPALENLERRGRLPAILVGVARDGTGLADIGARARESLATYGDGVDPDALDRLRAKFRLVSGDYRDDATFAELRKALDGASRPCHYLAIPPSLFVPVTEKLGASGCAAGARVVVEKAAGPRSRERTHHQPRAAESVRRELDLPHRPLPRQGAGAEPALLPLRQQLHRAGLEPHARRERADHHGREIRRRGTGPPVRGTRCGARRRAEPPAAGTRDPRDGASRSAPAPKRFATRR